MRPGLTPCHIWEGTLDKNGYGQTNVTGTTKRAHRIAWKLSKGETPPGLRHICDNRPCCNVDHLTPGTQQENVRDRQIRGRQARGERQGNAHLTERKVKRIFRLRRSGLSLAAVATQIGLSKSHCCSILKGHYWKHLGLHLTP